MALFIKIDILKYKYKRIGGVDKAGFYNWQDLLLKIQMMMFAAVGIEG